MSLGVKRQNFIDQAKAHFEFLSKSYGYAFKGIRTSELQNELIFENTDFDRLIVLSNQYHPNDYGFEVQLYRPSISTHHSDREILLSRLKENQDPARSTSGI